MKYELPWMAVLTDRLPADFKGLAEGHPGTTREHSGSFRAASDTRTCQRYRHADGPYFGLGFVRTTVAV